MTFDEIFSRLITNEGGYVNDPNDPGGETKYGISKRSYPHLDIKNLTLEQAKEIYKKDFWNPLMADSLSDGMAFQLFDFAVNSGILTATRALQRAIRVVDDGHFGIASHAALSSYNESEQIMLLIAERLEYLSGRRKWDGYSKGWVNRIVRNLRYAVNDI